MHLLSVLLVLSALTLPPELKIPLRITINQTVGFAPLTLRVKTRAEAEGKEVCVVVDGPESMVSCRVLDGITWTQDFVLRTGGEYLVFATSERYRTPALTVQVVGVEEGI